MIYTVYGLIDPRDQSTFYIGITLDIKERLKQHLRYDEANVRKDQHIREIVAAGHVPVIQALERTTSIDEARRRERRRIWEVRMKGNRSLCNIVIPRFKYRGQQSRPVEHYSAEIGRERSFARVIDMLVIVRETGQWPPDVTPRMQQYYKREYREFFRNGKKWAKLREAKIRKAAQLKAQNRQSRTMRRGASQC